MSEGVTFDSPIDEAAYYEEAIARCFEEINRRLDQLAEDQKEIDRLNSETWEILERLKAA